MSQFFKKFLIEEGTRLNPEAGQYLALGAFGKHPGWDDHIEDLGLETETLTLAKRILYVQGVGGQIDTGAWEKLEQSQRLEEFNHIFVWQRSGQFLLGRLWSSSDGKGRTRYPMVLCVHCIGASLRWGLEYILPRLLELEQACKDTSSAATVRSLMDTARARLRAMMLQAEKETQLTPSVAQALQRFVAHPVFGAGQEGWFRILYQLQNQMAAFSQGGFNPKSDLTALRPQHIRLPLGADSTDEALLLWRRFFAARIERSVPIFLALSPGESWLDAVLGEPSSSEFFCLRARPAVLPFATDVPYELSEDFKTTARSILGSFQTGKAAPTPAEASSEAGASGGWISVTQRWFKGKGSKLWLVGGVLVALLGGAAVLVLKSPSGKTPESDLAKGGVRAALPSPTGSAGQKETTLASKPLVPTVPVVPKAPMTAVSAQAEPDAVAAGKPAVQTTQPSQPPPMPIATAVPAAPPAEPPSNQAPATIAAVKPAAETVATSQPPPMQLAAAAPAPPPAAPLSNQTAPAMTAARSASALRQVFTNTVGMVLVWIASLPGTADGGYVSKYEVTQQQFERVMGSNPSQSKNELQPVESVTWQEAVEFCHKVTALDKNPDAAPRSLAYALPTEAQWEFFLGDAKFDDAVTSRTVLQKSPAPVGSLPANQYGLCDVLGNVWEFCAEKSTAPDRILKGTAFDNRKLITEKAGQWRPLERTTPRRLAAQDRAADAGFRCIALWQP
jgi:hypothetical protein